VLGIDLSTTSAKAGVLAADGRLVAVEIIDYESRYGPGGIVEQDAFAWWDAATRAVRAVLAHVPDAAVEGVSISSQGITVVPVGDDNQPIRAALTWLDLRATAEAGALAAAGAPEAIFRLTGRRPSAAYTLPKLMWLRMHEPDVFARARAFLLPMDFLLARLTGVPTTDHTMASGTLCYDLTTLGWSPALLQHAGLDATRLPPIQWAASLAGSVNRDASRATGLREGTPVFVGGQDQKCAALAAGLESDVVTISLGTAAAIIALTREATLDPAMRVPACPYLFPGGWLLEGVVGTAGASLAWLRRILEGAGGMPLDYDVITSRAGQSPIGARGVRFYPHLSGATAPSWHADARGAFCGLALSTTLDDCARAVLEGVALQVRANLDAMTELGVRPSSLRVFGGGAKSSLWREILAAATGLPIMHSDLVEAAVLGAAALAALGAGLWTSPSAGVAALRRWGGEQRVQPAAAAVEAYDRVYTEYCATEARVIGHA
jgi:xylulokinase